MKLHLWHFTHHVEDAREIQDKGFRDNSSQKLGCRWPCFSRAGERYWEEKRGPALVEVWIDIDEQLLADYFTRHCVDDYHVIDFYQIDPALLDAPGVKRLAHDNADRLPTIGGQRGGTP
jgi:hypothetical protein